VDILLLSTPAQYEGDDYTPLTKPSELQKWLQNLSTNDVLKTVNDLNSAIEALNMTDLASNLRFKLLEQFYNSFESVLYFYDEMRIRQLNIPQQEKRAVTEDIMWLYLTLAQGYKIIVKQEFEKGATPDVQTSLLRAMYRALELISFTFLYAFQSNVSIPPLAFLESHQLYYHARRFNAHDVKVRVSGGGRSSSTIDRLYKQLMLLIIAKRCPLDSMQFMELYMILDHYSQLASVNNRNDSIQTNFCYLVDYMSDDPPMAYQATVSPISGPSQYVLDIGPSLDAIYKHLLVLGQQDKDGLVESEMELLSAFMKTFLPSNLRLNSQFKVMTTP